MQKILLRLTFIAFMWIGHVGGAQAQSLAFTQSQEIGTSTTTNSISPGSQVRDQAGNVYTSGAFLGTLAIGSTTLTSLGSYDVFLTKQDAAGNYVWVRQVGGTGSEFTPHLVADAAGNLYVASATESASLHVGPLTLVMGQAKFAIARLDAAGNVSWAVPVGGPAALLVRDVALAPNGNLCLTGTFADTVSFGSTKLNSAGDFDIVVASLTSTGTWAWAVRFGGVEEDTGWGIAVDGAGNHYVTGSFSAFSGVPFGTTTLYSNNGSDAFVVKLTATGVVSWAVKAGSDNATDASYDVALDSAGNPYITGIFSLTATFGAFTLTSAGNYDAFVARLTPAGVFQWVTRFGGTDYEYGDLLTIQDNEVYLAAHFFGTTTFGANTFISAGGIDLALCQLSDTGAVLGTVAAGSSKTDVINSLQAVGNHQVEAVGSYSGPSITFGATTLTAPSLANKPFVTRLAGRAVPLSVRGTVTNSSLVAWPNPTTAALTLANVDAAALIEVYDVRGRLVATYLLTKGVTEQSIILPSGLYLVRNGGRTLRLTVN